MNLDFLDELDDEEITVHSFLRFGVSNLLICFFSSPSEEFTPLNPVLTCAPGDIYHAFDFTDYYLCTKFVVFCD